MVGRWLVELTNWQSSDGCTFLSPNSTLLVTFRHDTCRTRRDEPIESCCSSSSTEPNCIGSTHRTCRVLSIRDATIEHQHKTIQDVELQDCQLDLDTLANRKPVQLPQEWRDMFPPSSARDDTCPRILQPL